MIEKELGSFNFAFDITDKTMKDEFFDVGMFDVGMFELAFQARNLIKKPGKYAMKLIVTEFTINEPVSQAMEIEQSEVYKRAVGN